MLQFTFETTTDPVQPRRFPRAGRVMTAVAAGGIVATTLGMLHEPNVGGDSDSSDSMVIYLGTSAFREDGGHAPTIRPEEAAAVVERVLFDGTNTLRVSMGRRALDLSEALRPAACDWSGLMLNGDPDVEGQYGRYYDHRAWGAGILVHDGTLAEDFAEAVPGWQVGGENVGFSPTIRGEITVDEAQHAAEGLLAAFTHSQGHFENMVEEDYAATTVCAVVRPEVGATYATVRFVRDGDTSPLPAFAQANNHLFLTGIEAADR